MTQGMEDRIRQKLAQGLQPLVLEVRNDSDRHSGHAGDDGSGESHFHVKVVSSLFNGKGRVERHRMVSDLLKEEMVHKIHALSVKAVSKDEYDRV
jgi:BolA protein